MSNLNEIDQQTLRIATNTDYIPSAHRMEITSTRQTLDELQIAFSYSPENEAPDWVIFRIPTCGFTTLDSSEPAGTVIIKKHFQNELIAEFEELFFESSSVFNENYIEYIGNTLSTDHRKNRRYHLFKGVAFNELDRICMGYYHVENASIALLTARTIGEAQNSITPGLLLSDELRDRRFRDFSKGQIERINKENKGKPGWITSGSTGGLIIR
jgi:hypothetical protein